MALLGLHQLLFREAKVQVYLARGKVLGGSSSTNATLYMRGTQADYDAWNVPGWGSREALKGFIACEDNENGKQSHLKRRLKLPRGAWHESRF